MEQKLLHEKHKKHRNILYFTVFILLVLQLISFISLSSQVSKVSNQLEVQRIANFRSIENLSYYFSGIIDDNSARSQQAITELSIPFTIQESSLCNEIFLLKS